LAKKYYISSYSDVNPVECFSRQIGAVKTINIARSSLFPVPEGRRRRRKESFGKREGYLHKRNYARVGSQDCQKHALFVF
jgi:hypothetical protein